MDAFKAGGGNAALQKLLKQRAGSAGFFINANHPLNVKPEKAYTPEQIASARRVIESRGRKALAAQNAKKLGEGKGSDYTYSGDQVFEKGKLVGNMKGGRFVPLPSEVKTLTNQEQIKINQKDPDTPSEPQVDTTPDEPLEAEPVPASEVTKPPSQRELLIKEASVKYKDSPFKQWAHANQKLAKALKPGQVGYAQVQEYFKEQEKNGKLKVKPEEKPFIKSNASQLQMGPGANDLRGYAGSTSPIA
jgi:hypothetical protein